MTDAQKAEINRRVLPLMAGSAGKKPKRRKLEKLDRKIRRLEEKLEALREERSAILEKNGASTARGSGDMPWYSRQ
jgi:predicted RNase H-like nuclease (RuvC/YqgF family)